MNLEVRLELLSDAAPGSGAGGPQVDREIVTDRFGLPVIPGRRLKGLWREATQEVFEAFTLAGQRGWVDHELCLVETLFGTETQAGLVRVGDARLAAAGEGEPGDGQAAQVLAEWLAWAQESRTMSAQSVLSAFTVIRRQTAIDASRGAAQDNTLRSTRLLRRGLRFAGPVALDDAEGADAARARSTLALAAAALRRLGTGRHRGAGRVRAALFDEHGNNLTATSLQRLEAKGGKERQ